MLQQPRLSSPLTVRKGDLFFIQDQGAIFWYYYQGIEGTTFHSLLRVSVGGSHMIETEIIDHQFLLHGRLFTIIAHNPATQEVTLTWD
jgi:hypothetical protein